MNLKKKAVGGIKWTFLSSIINVLLQMVQLIILAKYLSPSDFGLMAVVTVLTGFSQLFIDMGISNVIIYNRSISNEELSSLYWLNVIIGICFFFIMMAISPFVSAFYRNLKLSSLMQLVAITFLIKPFGQQFMVILHRDMQFKATSLVEVIAKIFSFSTIIFLVTIGFGVYSIAIGSIIYSFGLTLGYNFYGRKIYEPFWNFKVKEVRKYMSFGLFQMGDKFLNYFALQMDNILVGKFLGIETLGLYNLAKDLTYKPYSIINPIITKVSFPLMSKVNSDLLQLKKIYLKTIKYLALLNFPIYLFILIFANEIVILFFGIKWIRAIPVIQILSLSFVLRSVLSPAGVLLLSQGKANITFYWNLLIFGGYPLFIFFGSLGGVNCIALAVLSIQVLMFLPTWKFIIYKFICVPFKIYLSQFLSPVFLSLLSMAISCFFIQFINNSDILLPVALIIFGLTYIIFIKKYESELYYTCLNIGSKFRAK